MEIRLVALERPLLFRDKYGGGIMCIKVYIHPLPNYNIAIRIIKGARRKKIGLKYIKDRYIDGYWTTEYMKILPPDFKISKIIWTHNISEKLSKVLIERASKNDYKDSTE